MALLGPRIGEKHQHRVQAVGGDRVAQHLHGVAANHSHIAEIGRRDGRQQPSDSGLVDVHPQIVALRVGARQGHQGLAVAETNFHDPRRVPREDRVQVQPPVRG